VVAEPKAVMLAVERPRFNMPPVAFSILAASATIFASAESMRFCSWTRFSKEPPVSIAKPTSRVGEPSSMSASYDEFARR
jgi:hypothetical protein